MQEVTVIPARFSESGRTSHSSGRYDYRAVLKKALKPNVYEKLESHWIQNLGVLEK